MYEVEIKIGDLFKLLNIDNEPGTFYPEEEIEVDTPFGYKKINGFLKTQLNPEWVIKTDSGKEGIFADYHRFETKKGELDSKNDKKWSFMADIKVGEEIKTRDGWEKVVEVFPNNEESMMYDLEVDEIACFYTNDLISHNTLTLQWLRNKAEKNNISYKQFKNIDEFMNDVDEYYSSQKKIFVFEDFDAALVERKDSNNTPNQVLSTVLNTLEGVEEINDVVSIFTTNHINVFDSAFLRPGRIDRVFEYKLPTTDNYLEFFKAYIPEEKEYFPEMIEHLNFLNSNISYAILKGICDDINIWKFSKKDLTIKEINDIIKNKVDGANKTNEVKKIDKYIL